MKDLIVTEFDHILINSEEEIPTSTIILFDELRRENKKLVIITDSSLKKILYYNYSYPFIDYIISSSGAYSYDVEKEKCIYKKNILQSNVIKIIKAFYNKCSIYLTDNNNYNLINGDTLDEDVTIIKDYNAYLDDNKNNIYKIDLIINSDISINDCVKKLNDMNLKIHVIVNENDDSYILSIVHEDVNKFNSLINVVKKNRKNINDVLYIGNDMNILENVDIGVTTSNEIPYLKKISSAVTDDCNHKGVENFLRKYYEKVKE